MSVPQAQAIAPVIAPEDASARHGASLERFVAAAALKRCGVERFRPSPITRSKADDRLSWVSAALLSFSARRRSFAKP